MAATGAVSSTVTKVGTRQPHAGPGQGHTGTILGHTGPIWGHTGTIQGDAGPILALWGHPVPHQPRTGPYWSYGDHHTTRGGGASPPPVPIGGRGSLWAPEQAPHPTPGGRGCVSRSVTPSGGPHLGQGQLLVQPHRHLQREVEAGAGQREEEQHLQRHPVRGPPGPLPSEGTAPRDIPPPMRGHSSGHTSPPPRHEGTPAMTHDHPPRGDTPPGPPTMETPSLQGDMPQDPPHPMRGPHQDTPPLTPIRGRTQDIPP